MPKILIELPMREKLRRDSVLPRWKKSSVLMDEPNRTSPTTDRELPKRLKLFARIRASASKRKRRNARGTRSSPSPGARTCTAARDGRASMTAACVAQSVRRLRCANSALFQVISGEAVAASGLMRCYIVVARWA